MPLFTALLKECLFMREAVAVILSFISPTSLALKSNYNIQAFEFSLKQETYLF